MSTASPYDRYQRQLILKGFGIPSQEKLHNAKVLVIGAGGLGCPVLQYLAAAGVGHIGVADHDRVSVSNLHRQVLFNTEDVGRYKVDVVKERINALNPDINVTIWKEKWDQQLCLEHFPAYDLIVDATDNFASRYMINDAAVLMGKAVVFGAVSQYEGQVSVFNHKKQDGSYSVNYRDIFPARPKDGEVLNCSEGGVLGVLPGIVGSMQATEVIKLLTGIGTPLFDKIWNYNALTQEVFMLEIEPNGASKSALPKNIDDFLGTDYEVLCNIPLQDIQEIDISSWQHDHLSTLLLDIREPHEQPRLNELSNELGFQLLELPLSQLDFNFSNLDKKNLVIICQAGRRSLQAAYMLMNNKHQGKVYSLKGGVNAMIENKII